MAHRGGRQAAQVKPLQRIESGFSTTINKGKLWVAVWRKFTRPNGAEFSDIDDEMYATPDEWREIVKQITALLEGLPE